MSSATDSLIFLLVLVPKPKICRLEIKGPTNSLTRSFLVFLSGVVVSLDQDARGQSIRINRYETISLCPSSSWPIKKKKGGGRTSKWKCNFRLSLSSNYGQHEERKSVSPFHLESWMQSHARASCAPTSAWRARSAPAGTPSEGCCVVPGFQLGSDSIDYRRSEG